MFRIKSVVPWKKEKEKSMPSSVIPQLITPTIGHDDSANDYQFDKQSNSPQDPTSFGARKALSFCWTSSSQTSRFPPPRNRRFQRGQSGIRTAEQC